MERLKVSLLRGFIALFRGVASVKEQTTPDVDKRERLRSFRLQMDDIFRDGDAALKTIDESDDMYEMMEAAEAFARKCNLHHDSTEHNRFIEKMRQMDSETETLQAIREQAATDTEAVAGFRAYIVQHPERIAGYGWLGAALLKAGQVSEAERVFRQELALAQTLPPEEAIVSVFTARCSLARALQAGEKYDEALQELQQIVKDNEGETRTFTAMAFFQMGEVYHVMGNKTEARKAWRQAEHFDETGALKPFIKEKLAANA